MLVTVTKDRPGHVRGRSIEGKVAVMELTGWPDGGVSVAFVPPGNDPAPDLALCVRILAYLSDYDGAAKNRIETDVDGKAERIRAALRWMAADGRAWIRIERVGQSHRHYLTAAGKEQIP